MKNINPIKTQAWNELNNHFQEMKNVHISDLFRHDSNRFKNFSLLFEDNMVIDFSKNIITQETITKLLNLADETYLLHAIQAMFDGTKINCTENRASLHIALRNRTNNPIFVNNENIMPKINFILEKMRVFSNAVINGAWKGYTNKLITNIVNIGIGGSDLGPKMVIEALRPYKNHLNVYYVSNVDGTNLSEVLKLVHPENTLFLIASKTFMTTETMLNAYSAKQWFLEYALDNKFLSKHFFAASENLKEVIKFGIDERNYFEFWDWVGGRYSLWSSAGLSIMLSIGYDNYIELLAGAHVMDQHFIHTEFKKNIPVLLALIGIWYNNFFKFETEAILPYDEYLRLFPAYFQQGNMESNGKSIDRNGKRVEWQTGPIIWGERGTNGQHAFYQLLHQGTKIVPCDFIAPILTHNFIHDHHLHLLSNFFAQTQALAFGKINKLNINNSKPNLRKSRESYVSMFQVFEGNRPTNSILLKKITPYSLGMLISMYEHKIFTQGVILNIFSFDQWGVELGKSLANNIINDLRSNKKTTNYDDSTNHLINLYKLWK